MNRLKLRDWSKLDTIRRKIETAAEEKRWAVIPDFIFEAIELCRESFKENTPWMKVAEAYSESLKVNYPRIKFPFLSSKEKGKDLPWDYPERTWYFWVNLLAGHYGWTQEYIGELDLDDALGLYEEILVNQQMKQEWEWGLSEIAYPYEKATKKQKFRPLSRPDWMIQTSKSKPVKTIKIPKSAMPVGNIVNLDES